MRRSVRAVAVALTVAAVVSALPRGSAFAEDDVAALGRARARFAAGEKLYALGRFEESLREYEAAYDAAPLPELLFNIGQCHRNLGHYSEAIFSFKKYLRAKPDADNRPAVQALVAELERERDHQAREATRQPKPFLPSSPVAPAPEAHPIYTRWWFVTGLLVVAGAAGATVALWPTAYGPPTSSLGNVDFPR